MSKSTVACAHEELVDGSQTTKHSHAGGGGVNVKSGTVSGSSGSVTFNTAFASTPQVALTTQDSTTLRDCLHKITAVSTTGFSWSADVSQTVAWIATDAGDP